MGNAAAKEFQEKELDTPPALHGDDGTKFVFSPVTTATVSLTGKSVNEKGKGGYRYSSEDGKAPFSVHAYGLAGRKGNLEDVDGKVVAEIRIEHHFKKDTHRYYKIEACYEGQEAEKVDDQDLYLFSKIEVVRTAGRGSSTYSVVTGKDDKGEPTFEDLYKGEQVLSRRFMAQVETASGDSRVLVGKITPLRGAKLLAEVASGVDLAAVILTGEACAPPGGTILALPGASYF